MGTNPFTASIKTPLPHSFFACRETTVPGRYIIMAHDGKFYIPKLECLIQLDGIKLSLSPSDVNKLKNLQLCVLAALATPNCCYLYVSKLFLNRTDFYCFLAICPE